MTNTLHHCKYEELKTNMKNVYGANGSQWISELPMLVDKLITIWQLQSVQPVDNMSFHFVAKALTNENQPVVLKIGIDRKVIESEMHALNFFAGHAAIKLIDYNKNHNALLLQQAVPGHSLKSIYPAKCDYVMNEYIKTVTELHTQKLPTNYSFPHISDWLTAIDQANELPKPLLKKAIQLKNHLLATANKEILLHGDLHQDNVLQNGNQWIVIDPKGIVGEPEFEAAVFDFIHPSEFNNINLRDLLHDRIQLFSKKSHFNDQRLKDWIFVRLILSAAWSIEDKSDPSQAMKLAQLLFAEI